MMGNGDVIGAYLESQFHQYDAAWQRPLEMIGGGARRRRLQHQCT